MNPSPPGLDPARKILKLGTAGDATICSGHHRGHGPSVWDHATQDHPRGVFVALGGHEPARRGTRAFVPTGAPPVGHPRRARPPQTPCADGAETRRGGTFDNHKVLRCATSVALWWQSTSMTPLATSGGTQPRLDNHGGIPLPCILWQLANTRKPVEILRGATPAPTPHRPF